MKKLITISMAGVSLLIASVTSYGQGQIQFQNATGITPITYGAGAATLGFTPGQRIFGAAGTFEYGLYLGSTSATDISQMTLVDTVSSPNATSATSAAAGAFNGGTVGNGANGLGNANGTFVITAGTTYSIEVAVWTKADGADYLTAFNSGIAGGLFGLSGISTITPTASPAGASQVFNPSGPFAGFSVSPNVVPEPTTLALGGLGAASLLLFRRKK